MQRTKCLVHVWHFGIIFGRIGLYAAELPEAYLDFAYA